jgi:FkbM family methyltransferase
MNPRSRELSFYLAMTRRLPPVPGVARITHLVRKFFLRKPRLPIVGDLFGARVVLDPNDWLEGQFIFNPQTYEHAEIRYVQRTLREGDLFLDAGAHIGFFSLAARQAVGRTGRVIAIDANPAMCARFQITIEDNALANIQVINRGLSDRRESLELKLHPENRGASSFLSEFQGGEAVRIPCSPLIDVLGELAVTRIAGAKFDLEGFEFRVLDHFLKNAAKTAWPDFIIAEHYPAWNQRAGGDLIQLLLSHGYRVVWHPRRKPNYILSRGATGG